MKEQALSVVLQLHNIVKLFEYRIMLLLVIVYTQN